MRFLIESPAFIRAGVQGEYVNASFSNPVMREFPDDTPLDSISRTWSPLDEPAQAALRRLGVDKPLAAPRGPSPRPPSPSAVPTSALKE